MYINYAHEMYIHTVGLKQLPTHQLLYKKPCIKVALKCIINGNFWLDKSIEIYLPLLFIRVFVVKVLNNILEKRLNVKCPFLQQNYRMRTSVLSCSFKLCF